MLPGALLVQLPEGVPDALIVVSEDAEVVSEDDEDAVLLIVGEKEVV